MSATYRIEVEHVPDPQSSQYTQWVARIIRLSDDYPVTSCWSSSGEGAVGKAKAWLVEQNVKQTGLTLYVDDAGEEVEAPLHSVKA